MLLIAQAASQQQGMLLRRNTPQATTSGRLLPQGSGGGGGGDGGCGSGAHGPNSARPYSAPLPLASIQHGLLVLWVIPANLRVDSSAHSVSKSSLRVIKTRQTSL